MPARQTAMQRMPPFECPYSSSPPCHGGLFCTRTFVRQSSIVMDNQTVRLTEGLAGRSLRTYAAGVPGQVVLQTVQHPRCCGVSSCATVEGEENRNPGDHESDQPTQIAWELSRSLEEYRRRANSRQHGEQGPWTRVNDQPIARYPSRSRVKRRGRKRTRRRDR